MADLWSDASRVLLDILNRHKPEMRFEERVIFAEAAARELVEMADHENGGQR